MWFSQLNFSSQKFCMSSPATAYALLAHYRNLADSLYASDTYTPFIYPIHVLAPTCLCAYLLIPPIKPSSSLHKPVFYLRYPVFSVIFYAAIRTIRGCRSGTVTVAYGIGLVSALGLLISATFLVFGDARGDFGRWERSDGRMETEREGEGITELNRVSGASGRIEGVWRKRGVDKFKSNILISNGEAESKLALAYPSDRSASTNQISEYIFQPLPSTFLHRLDWVLDLMTNLRGINWSYRAPHQPPRPPSPPRTRSELLRSTILSAITNYFLIHVLKTLTLYDTFFLTLSA